MSNKDLLKQAIAEAKTIREAAIANAKEALEETLTPHLKDMLAAKLQEMEEAEDEEIVNEEETLNNPEEETAHGNVAEAETEEEEEEESEEGEESEEEESEEEEVEIEDMSIDQLKDLIRDIIAQETGAEGGEIESEEGEEAEYADDLTGADAEEEIDINELLSELSEEEEGAEVEEGIKDVAKKIGGKLEKGFDRVSQALYGKPGEKQDPSKADKFIDKGYNKLKKAGFMDSNMTKGQRFAESAELEEALETIETLRTQLQEVNLLNAKLLYVNKVFKSNNLSESQKVNVIAAFDKAETVKEVKLVFETVSKNVVAKPAAIKEHKSFASKATGTTARPANPEIISEVSETVKRMQRLAGII